MTIELSKAYQVIYNAAKEIDPSINLSEISLEIQESRDVLREDFCCFDKNKKTLEAAVINKNKRDIIESLALLHSISLGISTEFSNFADDIEQILLHSG